MKNLIYYPGFEVQNITWLKFALLYIDNLNPIIPETGDATLSNLYRLILNETDLINLHRPSYEEGSFATLDAIEIIEKILNNPSRYIQIFYSNVLRKWRIPEQQNYILFEDKYTNTFEDFIIENGLGYKGDYRLYVPFEIGMIYMTILAQVIASKRQLSSITDRPDLDKFSMIATKAFPMDKSKISVAQSVINYKLPKNISDIPINKIIEFRNRPGFKERLNAFHKELDSYYDQLGEGFSSVKFVKEFENVFNEFAGDILQLGFGVVELGLSAWILFNSPQNDFWAFRKDVLLAGTSLLVGGIINLKVGWKHTTGTRYCRRYLADLSKL